MDGEKSLRDHLEQLEATTGHTPAELINATELPPELAHVWGWFIELSNSRPGGFGGIEPLTFPVIESWIRVTGNQPSANDVTLIRKVDDLYRSIRQKK